MVIECLRAEDCHLVVANPPTYETVERVLNQVRYPMLAQQGLRPQNCKALILKPKGIEGELSRTPAYTGESQTYPLRDAIRKANMFVCQTYEQACELVSWNAFHSYPLEIWRCHASEVVPLKKRLARIFIADFAHAYWEEQWYLCSDEQEYPRKYLPGGKRCYLSQPYEGECVCQQLQLLEKMPLLQPLRMSSSQTNFHFRVRQSWNLMKQLPSIGQ